MQFIMSTITKTSLKIKSNSFKNNGAIPSKYCSEGLNVNPALYIEDLPKHAKSLAIIVNDPDAKNGDYCHWIVWDVAPKKTIKENSSPGIQGRNSKGINKYLGPCPPAGIHHYHFQVFALDTKLTSLPPSSNEKELKAAMQNHIIAKGVLIGLYKKMDVH